MSSSGGDSIVRPLPDFFHGVVWPAVAGNVIWALVTVGVQEIPGFSDLELKDKIFLLGKLLSLLFWGAYLAIDWINTHKIHQNMNDSYWIWDVCIAIPSVIYAIAVVEDKDWAIWFLVLAFIAAAVAHSLGSWDNRLKPSSKRERIVYTAINIFGAAIAVFVIFCTKYPQLSAPAAVIVTVSLYLSVGNVERVRRILGV